MRWTTRLPASLARARTPYGAVNVPPSVSWNGGEHGKVAVGAHALEHLREVALVRRARELRDGGLERREHGLGRLRERAAQRVRRVAADGRELLARGARQRTGNPFAGALREPPLRLAGASLPRGPGAAPGPGRAPRGVGPSGPLALRDGHGA